MFRILKFFDLWMFSILGFKAGMESPKGPGGPGLPMIWAG